MGEYYLGLDMGTGSLGWAVTDAEYRLCRAHGKDLWGIRLFKDADTAEARRGFRCARRRTDRKKQRIHFLQEIFAPEINKIDPGFFLRLKESRYVPEDKRDSNGDCPALPYSLFVDKDYTDKDFHKEYPTIYHLRKELMESEKPVDIRLVYLALHHIIKHRGHFLFAGIEADKVTDFKTSFDTFINTVKESELDFNLEYDDKQLIQVRDILKEVRMSKTKKASEISTVLHATTSCEKSILKLISGCKVKLSTIFDVQEYDSLERNSIIFSDSSYEDNVGEYESSLSEHFPVIAAAKALYDWSVLVAIIGDSKTISEAKVKVYEKHKADLARLKTLVREELTENEYKELFVKTNIKKCNYCSYIGMTKKNGHKVTMEEKACNRDDFYKYLKKDILGKIKNNKEADEILEEIELGTFLPKQVSKDNGVIPYQLHLVELQRILEKAGEYLPFLKEQYDKILQILTFRIPYYVGPLNGPKTGKNSFSWAIRKSDEKIYPWNFDEVIDKEKSAEEFILRMTNKCTYLYGEDVLPKDSLLYSKFMVLNELNNLCIDDEKISVELKQELYEKLFKRYRRVTNKRLREYLKVNGLINENTKISGIDGDFKASLKAYHDFKEKLTGAELTNKDKENIILNISLFGDDKNLLKSRLKKLYPNFTAGQTKAVCSLNYTGWGRLSRKFLEELEAPNKETGEAISIIRAMWETNNNLMQLLSIQYGYSEMIEAYNGETTGKELTYKTVDELYVSPAVKRQIWQTVQVIKEIKKVMGKAPARVFLEVTREKQESKRTVSRKNALKELYKQCKNEERDWASEIDSFDEHIFKSDRLYLYYTQKARCMYCGKPIELENLWDKNIYDIDHIYPQSKVMDDSLKNRILTCKTCNANKGDAYPISGDIRQKMRPHWSMLKAGGFIEEEKYKRLVRSDGFSSDELAGFIARQLVETSQSVKAVADIIKQSLPDTELIYSKAKIVSEFKNDFNFIKVREINDYHHAKDAYLNIVVGNTYYVKFTKDAAWFVRNNPGRTYSINKMFTSGYDVARNGEIAWKAGDNGTIKTVKKMMHKNSVLFTRRSYEATGGLFDQMLMKKDKGQVPIKSSDERLCDLKKYGGYNKAAGAYFVLVESDGKKGEKKRTIEVITLYKKAELEKSKENMLNYFKHDLELKNPRILLDKIKIDTLFEVDGFKMHLSGRTSKQLLFKGAEQLIVSEKHVAIIKKIVNVVNQLKKDNTYKINDYDKLTTEALNEIYEELECKLLNPPYVIRLSSQIKTISEGRNKFDKLSIEEKCQVIVEMLHLFECDSTASNLSTIGGAAKAGILVLSNQIDKCNKIFIINQSITGIYEQKINLKEL